MHKTRFSDVNLISKKFQIKKCYLQYKCRRVIFRKIYAIGHLNVTETEF